MSYREQTTVELHCDCKGCIRYIRVQGEDHNDCQISLYEAGWRLSHGKQICPMHIAAWYSRMAGMD